MVTDQNSKLPEIEDRINITLVIKNIGKNISKNLNSKCWQKLPDHAKQSATDAFKTFPKRAVSETAEETIDLIGNKFADKNTKVLQFFLKNKSETNEEEILREKYVSPELRQKLIDDLKEENFQ